MIVEGGFKTRQPTFLTPLFRAFARAIALLCPSKWISSVMMRSPIFPESPSMPVPLRPSPTHLTAGERALEVTRILAGAIRRQHASLPEEKDPVGLGFAGPQRVNGTPFSTERVS